MSSTYQNEIDKVTELMESANTAVMNAVSQTTKAEAIHNETVILRDLQSATAVVRESITNIASAQAHSESFTNTELYEISSDVVLAFKSIQSSLTLGMAVQQTDIDVLKSFETTTSEIMELLLTSKVEIKGFEAIIAANKEMERTVSSYMEEKSSRSSIVERVEIITRVNYYISYIGSVASQIENAVASADSPQTFAVIGDANSYISSLDVTLLTSDIIIQLEAYAAQMDTALVSMQSNSNTVTDIETLQITSNATIQKLETILIEASYNEQRLVTIERTESVVSMLSTLSIQISNLSDKMSPTGTQTEASVIQSIESVIIVLEVLVYKFTSKSYEILEEDITTFTEELTTFTTLVSEVQSFTEIKGLSQLLSVVQSATTVMERKETSLVRSFEIKMQLETFEYMSSLLGEVKTHVSSFTEISVTTSSASLVLVEIQKLLVTWSQGVEYVQRSSVESFHALFTSFQMLMSSSTEIHGRDSLVSIITILETKLEESIQATKTSETKSETRYNKEVALNLISDTLVTLQQIEEVTQVIGGTEQPVDQVSVIISLVTRISRKQDITTTFITEFKNSLFELNQFFIDLQIGSLVTQVTGLDKAITLTKSVKKTLQSSLKQEGVSSIHILMSINQVISTTVQFLERKMNDTSTSISEVETMRSEAIDEFFEYLLMIQEQTVIINAEFLQTLQMAFSSIQQLISSTNEYIAITGYRYNITEIISYVTQVTQTITVMIFEEQRFVSESLVFSQTQSILNDVIDIASTLEVISSYEVQSQIDFSVEFHRFTLILTELSLDMSSFTSFSNITDIKRILWTIADSNEKPNGIDSLLLTVQSTLEVVIIFVTEIEEQRQASLGIKQMNAVIQMTTTMVSEISNALVDVQPQQLVGEDNEAVQNFIDYLTSFTFNIDSLTEEVLTVIAEEYNELIIIITDTLETQGIGNLITLRNTIMRVLIMSETRVREHRDRAVVKLEISHTENAVHIVQELQTVLSSKIEKITSVTMNTIDQNTYEEIRNSTVILEKIVHHSIQKVSEEELNETLSALQSLQVTPGTEITGIFELHSLTKESIAVINSDRQFLKSTLESRKSIDILSKTSEYMIRIESLLEEMLVLSREAEKVKDSTTSTVFKDLKSLQEMIIKKETLSYSYLDDIESLIEDLEVFRSRNVMSVEIISQALEITRSATFMTSRTLYEVKRVSQERQDISRLEMASTVLTRTETELRTIGSLIDVNGMESEEENVVALLAFIDQEMSVTMEFKEDTIISLQKLIETVETVDKSVFNGKNIVGLKSTLNTVTVVKETVQLALESSKKQVATLAIKSVKSQAILVMEHITETVTNLLSSMTSVTSERDEPIVTDILALMNNVSIEYITMEQITVLNTMSSTLETIEVKGHIGVSMLRELKSVTIAKKEAFENDDKISSVITTVTETKKMYSTMQSMFAFLKEELLNISTSSVTDSSSRILSTLTNLTSVDVTSLNQYYIYQLQDFIATFTMVKATVQVDVTTVQSFISTITKHEREVVKQVRKLESKRTKLQQTQTFTEIQTLVSTVEELTQQITQTSGEETKASEANDSVRKLVILFDRFRVNILSISDADLVIIRSGIVELRRILSRQSSVKGVSKLSEMVTSIVSTLSREKTVLEMETKRVEKLHLETKQENMVSYTQSVLQMLAAQTSEFTSSTDSRTENRVFEIERITFILTLVQQGKATEMDVEQLQAYVQVLESSISTYTSETRISGLSKVIKTTESIKNTLGKTVIENSFDVNYSETVYTQKQMKSVLSETSNLLEALMVNQGNGTDGSFTHTVFTDILQSLEKLESRSYEYSLKILERNVALLKTVSENVTYGLKIIGLSKVVQKTQSAVVTMESTISRSYSIEFSSQEVVNLKEAKNQLLRFEFILTKIAEKGESSGSSKNVMEMTEILKFFEYVTAYTLRELILLREYVDLFFTIYQDLDDEGVANITTIITHVTKQRKSISAELSSKGKTQRSEKQLLFTDAASSAVQNAYVDAVSVKKDYNLIEVQEVQDITQFSIFLQTVDMSSITAVGISEMRTEMEKFSQVLTEYSDVQSIAYLNSITEQLVQFRFAAERHLQTRKTFEIEEKVSHLLKESKTALKSTAKELTLLKEMISDENITTYVEYSEISEIYNLLSEYSFDFRLITEEFPQKLMNINYTSIKTNSGEGVKYLSEVLLLVEKFVKVEEQTSSSVKSMKTVLAARELQSSVSSFSKAIQHFVYSSEESEGTEESSEVGTEGSANNTDSGSTIGMGTDSSSNSTTESSSATTTDSADDLDFSSEADYEEIFEKIQYNIGKMSSEAIDFQSISASETIELITMLMESDVSVLFKRIGRKFLQRPLYQTNAILTTISSSIETSESSLHVEKSVTQLEETETILKSIENSYSKILTQQRGSSDTFSILSSITEILNSFTSVYFISSEDVSLLRSYSYELSIASTSTEVINITDTSLFSRIVKSTMTSVQLTTTSQTALITVSKLSGTSSSSSTSSKSFSYSAYKSQQESSTFEIVYSEDEQKTIGELSKSSQQIYTLTEFSDLLENSLETLQEISSSISSDNGSTTIAPSGSESDPASDDDGEMEENEYKTLFSQIRQILQVSVANVDNLQYDTLISFASIMKKIKNLMKTTIVVDTRMLSETISYTMSVASTLSQAVESQSAVSEASQVFTNYQEASASVQKITDLFSSFESLSQNTSSSVIDEVTSHHITTVNNFVIEYSMRASSITSESLRIFKESFNYIQRSMSSRNIYIEDYKLWKTFLVDSKRSMSKTAGQSASKGAVVRFQTQKNKLIFTEAKSVIGNYMGLLSNFTSAFTGTEESSSQSRGRLLQILQRLSEVSRRWAKGKIENHEVSKFRSYFTEMQELSVILAGSKAPKEINQLRLTLRESRNLVRASIMRTELEESQDIADADIDAKYDYYSQMDFFLLRASSISADVNDTQESVMPESTTLSNNDSLQNVSISSDDGDVSEINSLLQIFKRSFSDPLSISIDEIHSNFTSLIVIVQRSYFITQSESFRILNAYVQDLLAYIKASLRAQAFERTAGVAESLSRMIKTDVNLDTYSESLIYVQEISDLYSELQLMSSQLFVISRSSVRKLQSYTYLVQRIAESYGYSVTYLSKIDEYLSQIQLHAKKLARNMMKHYSHQRAVSILDESSEVVSQAESSLESLLISSQSLSAGIFVENEVITKAYFSLLSLTADLSLMPRNLGAIISDYDFGSIWPLEGFRITYLEAVYNLIIKINRLHRRSKETSTNLDRSERILRVEIAISNIVKKLKEFAIRLEEEEENPASESSSSLSGITTLSPESTTFANTSQSSVNVSEEEAPVNVDDVIYKIINISNHLLENGFDTEDDVFEELYFYSSFIQSMSYSKGREIYNIQLVLDDLSLVVSSLSSLAHAYESAVQVEESYAMITELRDLNKFSLDTLIRLSEDPELTNMTDFLEEKYEAFSKGFTFVTEEDINFCWETVYEISYMNITQDGNPANTSNLLSLIENVDLDLTEIEGFLSAHSYHYNRVFEMMKYESNSATYMRNFAISSASQMSYILFEIDRIFSGFQNTLSKFSHDDTPNNNTDILTEKFSEIASILKAARGNPRRIHFDILYQVSKSIDELEVMAKDSSAVNITIVDEFNDTLSNERVLFAEKQQTFGDYGRASTQVLILQNALRVINQVTSEAAIWINGTQNNYYSTSDVTLNSTEDYSLQSENYTAWPSTQETSMSTVTLQSLSNTTEDEEEIEKKSSFQANFDDISDMLMFWNFDSNSFKGHSVMELQNFMESLSDSCQIVYGLHTWDQILIDANPTLSSLVDVTFMKNAREKAELEGILVKYGLLTDAVSSYKSVFGENDNEDDNEVSNSTSNSTDSSNTTLSVDDEPYSSETANNSVDVQEEVISKINELMSLSRRIFKRWALSWDVRESEISELASYYSEVSELLLSGGTIGNISQETRENFLTVQNHTITALNDLLHYSSQAREYRSHVMHISFFTQLQQLVIYSIEVVTLGLAAYGNGSFGNASSTATPSMASTDAAEVTNASSSFNGTDVTCEDLHCATMQLLSALQQLSINDSIENNTSTTVSQSNLTSTESSYSEDNTEITPLNNGSSLQRERTSYMDRYIYDEFAYRDLRTKVYTFSTEFRKLDLETDMYLVEIKDALVAALTIIEEKVRELENLDLTPSINVTIYTEET
ncbi:hypothetical protein SK128_023537, partial [Halocaridina rubra]